jgi:hypothetical protein
VYIERNGKQSVIRFRSDTFIPDLKQGNPVFFAGAAYTLLKYDVELKYIDVDENGNEIKVDQNKVVNN